MEVRIPRLRATQAYIAGIEKEIDRNLPSLLREISSALRDDVRKRIITSDGGTWKPPSKWIRAKKNSRKALAGMQKFVRSRVLQRSAEVYFDSPGDWTLTQHEKGFVNKLIGPKDMAIGSRVILNIINPRPLGLPSPGSFSFVPQEPGITPARRIWTNEAEAYGIAEPLVSRWVTNRLFKKAKFSGATFTP